MIHASVRDVAFDVSSIPSLARPQQVLLTEPSYFQVEYVINPHMSGQIGSVDPDRALAQWQALVQTYSRLGFAVATIPGTAGLPDMVFCANQTLPYVTADGRRGIVPSRMFAEERADEVETFVAFFAGRGYDVARLPETIPGALPEVLQETLRTSFEGMGDAIWHPGRRLIWGGHGFRTDPEAYAFISQRLDVPVLLLELSDPDFYHLDTCLSVLDPETAVIFPGAFDEAGRELLAHVFPRLIEAPEDESRGLFACNAHCPDGRHVLIQRGCETTSTALRRAGFEPVEMDTDEFLKAGGSVFCMKQMFW